MTAAPASAAPSVRRVALLPLAAAGVTVVLWASAFVGIRSASLLVRLGPDRSRSCASSWAAWRSVSSSSCAARGYRHAQSALRGIVICGVLWFGVYNVALNEAERRIDAGTASMLVNVGPVLIAVLAGAFFFLGEGFPRRLLAGCLVAFGSPEPSSSGSRRRIRDVGASSGALLCLLAAVAYSIGVINQKPALRHASALQVTWLACVVGAIACLPFAPGLVEHLQRAPARSIGWGLGTWAPRRSAIGFMTWAYALARNGRAGASASQPTSYRR